MNASAVIGQEGATALPTRQWADSVMKDLAKNKAREPNQTLSLTARMLSVYRAARDTCQMARVSTYRAMAFNSLGKLDSGLVDVQRSFDWYKPECDSLILLRAYLSMADLYIGLNRMQETDSLCTVALTMWNPAWEQTAVRNGLNTDRAIAKAQMGQLESALADFRAVLRFAREGGNEQDIDDALSNIGVMHGMMDRLDSSDHYYRMGLTNALMEGDPMLAVKQYMNLGENQGTRGAFRDAIALYDSALALANEHGLLQEAVWIENKLGFTYVELGDHRSAVRHLTSFIALNDSLMNIEKVRSVAEMQQKYESEKKAKEILGLKAEGLESALRQARIKRTRNIYMFIGIGVFVVAFGLLSRLRYVNRAREAIQKEKDVSEGLLLNILPEEVAAELKMKGYADAKEFETATILFSDFKGFTQLSEKLSADGLIKELNTCFKAFDGIMGQYRVEKIKTIGDAYMAAGGLPDAANGSPAEVLLAALDMQAFMRGYAAEREAEERPYFTMRVGLHTGPVIAGIVGVKKFAYDIWGDTVNTASRMESSGEVGRVNISHATYLLVKDDPRFVFTSRGMVAAKGKGELEMWFADRAA